MCKLSRGRPGASKAGSEDSSSDCSLACFRADSFFAIYKARDRQKAVIGLFKNPPKPEKARSHPFARQVACLQLDASEESQKVYTYIADKHDTEKQTVQQLLPSGLSLKLLS